MGKVLVVGGGPSGMISAIIAARNGNEVLLFEKNKKLGMKLYITGKGRCNITNACDTQDLFLNITGNSKFLYSAFYGFTNFDVIDFFEKLGLKTKVERGNRVFPLSDKSSDVIGILQKELKKCKVMIRLNARVTDVFSENGEWTGIEVDKREKIKGDKLILATGGLSYPVTGSTGDGYLFAKKLGHNITDLYPSLVPFNVREDFIKELQGLSLKNIEAKIEVNGKEIYREFGEMVFTHFGVSGPVILSGSCYIGAYVGKEKVEVIIDLKPALTIEQLDHRISREFLEFQNKQYKNSLEQLLPRKLIPVIISLSEINPDKKVNVITKEERMRLVRVIKGLRFTIESLRDYKEAIITKGGIALKEIQPGTMESRYIKNVYFVGEVLDLDGVTGGFNLQIAWSTGYAAGNS